MNTCFCFSKDKILPWKCGVSKAVRLRVRAVCASACAEVSAAAPRGRARERRGGASRTRVFSRTNDSQLPLLNHGKTHDEQQNAPHKTIQTAKLRLAWTSPHYTVSHSCVLTGYSSSGMFMTSTCRKASFAASRCLSLVNAPRANLSRPSVFWHCAARKRVMGPNQLHAAKEASCTSASCSCCTFHSSCSARSDEAAHCSAHSAPSPVLPSATRSASSPVPPSPSAELCCGRTTRRRILDLWRMCICIWRCVACKLECRSSRGWGAVWDTGGAAEARPT